MRLRCTREGLVELEEGQSPQGARAMKRAIQAATEILLRHPRAERLTRNPHLRRLVASPYPYLIFCRLTEDEIIIHGVRHGARDPGTMTGDT